MCEETLTVQELSWEEKRSAAEMMAKNLIAGAREHRQEEVKEEDLFKVPATLREALTLHLLNFEWRPGDDSAQGMMAKQIALTIARIEDILKMERESRMLGRDIEVHIGTFSALKTVLSSCDRDIDADAMYLLLDDLHAKALDNIHETLKDYVVIPKSEVNREVIS